MVDNGNDSQVPRHCASCTKPDELDDMVACDACHNWHHYSCAQVDATVQDRAWKCASCELPTNSDQSPSGTGVKEVNKTGAKPKAPIGLPQTLAVPSKKSGAKSSAGSRKSKKVTGEQSTTSSARMRLEAELKAVEEQQRIKEEELAAEKELQDLERKMEAELRERELAIETKRIAEAKAELKKKISDEREFRMKQMAIRRQSEEEKAKLIRQASEYGSTRGSLVGSATRSDSKVEDWLEKSTQQTAGPLQQFTSAVDPSCGQTQVFLEKTNRQQPADIRADRSLDSPPLTLPNKAVPSFKPHPT